MSTKYKTLDELVAEVAPARCVQVWPRLSAGHPYLEVKRDEAGKPVFMTQKPVGNRRYDEADVWADIVHHTEDGGGVLVIGLWGWDVRKEWDDNSGDTQILEKLEQAGANLSNVLFASLEKTKGEDESQHRKIDLGDRITLKVLVDVVRKNDSVSSLVKVMKGDRDPASIPVEAVVIYEPNLEEDDLKYLNAFRKSCPHVDVYIFHYAAPEKRGVEVEGESNTDGWEDEFPSLADLKFEPLETIVDNFLIRGNIHVAAGRHESYKTMALLELSDAILSQRPAFDYFKVNQRYPVLFLCPDMSSEQFDDYAAPFNVRKHGTDFRVQRPRGDIIHAVDSPILQQAVNGRILILDTMLDFARIKELGQSGEWITFMQQLRELMTVHGCAAIILTAHANKPGAKSATIDSSDYLKDSVTFGGKVDVAYGFKGVSNTSQITVERIKGRGFKKPLKFTITINDDDGESHLSRGRFPVCQEPGQVKSTAKKTGRKESPDKQAKIDFALKQEGTLEEKTAAMNAEFGSDHGKSTLQGWLEDAVKRADFEEGLTV